LKKILLVLGALMMVVSGVASVSAYEAHLINVTAHVENAMQVNKDHIQLGTVFPEEWVLNEFIVGVSGSFCDEFQWRVTKIDYAIFAEWKPVYGTANPVEYYPWLGDALYIGIDAVDLRPIAAGGDLTPVGPTLPSGPPGTSAIFIMQSSLGLDKNVGPALNLNDTITIGLDVPVFEGYYNALTDMLQADGTYLLKPSGLSAPTVVILESDTARYFPDGVTLGVDLKIQVENIYN